MSKLIDVSIPDIGDFDTVDVIEVLVAVGDTIKAVLMDADPVKGSIIFAPSVFKDDLSRAKKFKKRRRLPPKTTS